ncbi:MAG: sulfurtransferase TusA family protein [Rhodospirillales bacterium]
MTTTHLDLKGLNCPLPVLRANKKMKEIMAGDILEIEVTDPAAPKDFKTYSSTTGHELVRSDEADGVYTISLKKSG